jgi:hypothetical protein
MIERNKLRVDISLNYICSNPEAFHLVKPDDYKWNQLSANPAAIKLLEANQDKIGWNGLCFNSEAIHIIERNLDKVCWLALSSNPSAIHLLEKNTYL